MEKRKRKHESAAERDHCEAPKTKKHGQFEKLTLQSKRMILCVNDCFEELKQKADADSSFCLSNEQLKRVVQNTANACNCSERTVVRLRKERRKGPLSHPNKPPGRSPLILDNQAKFHLRQAFFDLYELGSYPTVDRLQQRVRELYAKFPKVTNKKFRTLMRSMGFRYKKRNEKWILYERIDVQAQRCDYCINSNILVLQ